MTQALDTFDLEAERPLAATLAGADIAFLLMSFSSDWLYPSYQLAGLAESIGGAGGRAQYHDIPSDYGHDAFLLDTRPERLVRTFLASVPASHSGVVRCATRHAARG